MCAVCGNSGGTASEHPDFELLRSGFLEDYNSTANIYRHRKTGLQVLSVLSNDANKMMGVTVRTLPDDNTGKAHVLEHMVLSGSESFPVRDVFLNLVDRSLFTYLNAITRRDSTLYPVSSANLADFYNLVSISIHQTHHRPLIMMRPMANYWMHMVILLIATPPSTLPE